MSLVAIVKRGILVKKYWKAILIVALVLAGLGWLVVDSMRERAAMTASATATVTRVAFDADEESSSLDETDIDYVFEAGGQKIDASSSLPGDLVKEYPAGKQIAICYQPKSPTTSRINPDGGPCGG
jgi:hypothetical protein